MAEHEPAMWLERIVPSAMRNTVKHVLAFGSSVTTLHLGMALLLVWVVLTCLAFAVGQTQASDASTAEPGDLQLIELFTSHGCSSCPAADRLLGELLEERENLLALEYHVDYWDALVHGSDGNFVDPFSKPEFSARQRAYNLADLAGRPGVYTPQAIINGAIATVGSKRREVLKALDNASSSRLNVVITREGSADGTANSGSVLNVSTAGEAGVRAELAGTDITLVRYKDIATTLITGGENRHMELVNHHVVMNITLLGEVRETGDMRFTVAEPAEGYGCVILVQEGASTPVYGAAECP